MASVSLGLGLGVASKAVASLGLVLQKRWHLRHAARTAAGEAAKPWYRDAGWVASFGTYAVGNAMTLPALALAPQTVIASLDSLVLVFNAGWAPRLLDERVSAADWGAIAVIITGTCAVVAGSPPAADAGALGGRELAWMLLRPAYFSFALLQAAALAAAVSEPRLRQRKAARRKALPDDDAGGGTAGGGGGAAAIVAAGIAPAVLSAGTMVLAKAVGEMVAATSRGGNEFADWPVYVFLFAFAAMNAWQVKLLQAALSGFSALAVVPVFQVSLTMLAVISGGLYFREFQRWGTGGAPAAAPGVFAAGLCLSCAGVAIAGLRGAGIPVVACASCGRCGAAAAAPAEDPTPRPRRTSYEYEIGGASFAARPSALTLSLAGTDAVPVAASFALPGGGSPSATIGDAGLALTLSFGYSAGAALALFPKQASLAHTPPPTATAAFARGTPPPSSTAAPRRHPEGAVASALGSSTHTEPQRGAAPGASIGSMTDITDVTEIPQWHT